MITAAVFSEQARIERRISAQERALGDTHRSAEESAMDAAASPEHGASWWMCCGAVAVMVVFVAVAFAV